MYDSRQAKLVRKLRTQGLDGYLVTGDDNLEYLMGISIPPCERFKGIFFLSDGRRFAVIPKMHESRFDGVDIPVYGWTDDQWFYSQMSRALVDFDLEGCRMAVAGGVTAVDIVEMLERHRVDFVSGRNFLSSQRIIKSKEELALMRKAGEITDRSLEGVLPMLEPGVTEGEVRLELLRLFEEYGAQGTSFEPTIAFGSNTGVVHYSAGRGVLREQDVVRFDIGCRYQGYCSDMGRTFFFGEVSDRMREIYGIVLAAQKAGEAAAKPGAVAGGVDRASRGVIERAGYGEYFRHRTGHGIGLAVHEAPEINDSSDTVLAEGMTFSVEPSIRMGGEFAVHIENCVAITSDGCKPFTHSPRELRVLK